MKVNEMERAVGGLSTPSKMPGFAYGLPAASCKVGELLRKNVPNSPCASCYAFKGMYVFPVVKAAQARRLKILLGDLVAWRQTMTALLIRKYAKKSVENRVFRWHDSGDIQSLDHLDAIVRIARDIPSVRFWLPTQERAMIRQWLRNNGGAFPRNLTVRVSAPIIGEAGNPIPGTVSSDVDGNGFQCPARSQGNECKNCRACWDPSVPTVSYSKH